MEAARAGEHGKGFAVVAQEVRSLANKSAEAAEETTKRIEDVIEQTKEGNRFTQTASKSLEETFGKVSNMEELFVGISNAAEEQVSGMEEMDIGLQQLTQTTQNNAHIAERNSGIIEELFDHASKLSQKVSYFKLEKSEESQLLSLPDSSGS